MAEEGFMQDRAISPKLLERVPIMPLTDDEREEMVSPRSTERTRRSSGGRRQDDPITTVSRLDLILLGVLIVFIVGFVWVSAMISAKQGLRDDMAAIRAQMQGMTDMQKNALEEHNRMQKEQLEVISDRLRSLERASTDERHR